MFACCCTDAGMEGEISMKEDFSRKNIISGQAAMTDESSDVMSQKVDACGVFEVLLDVEAEDSCGIVPDTSHEAFPIVRQVTGAAFAWNNGCPMGLEIKRYDRILTVNGEDVLGRHTERQLDARDKRRMKLTLKHPVERELFLQKPGLVMSWNNANPDKTVSANDRIIGVNGIQGEPNILVERLRENSDIMVLTVLCYS
eukprot:TRINITY_DN7426_c0_g1_i3.p2 TRINITY_DN7426_c0_g1~~TRINITY_DN7426_c0_g1_i3.p2  ORF type:complete len:199 (-),score=40.73 TRINITY_DN7426_c0_g1_i3:175-771(-)